MLNFPPSRFLPCVLIYVCEILIKVTKHSSYHPYWAQYAAVQMTAEVNELSFQSSQVWQYLEQTKIIIGW